MSLSRSRRILLPLLLLAGAVMLAGCVSIDIDGESFGSGEEGSGDLVIEHRAVADFTAIHISGALRTEVSLGPVDIEVEFDDNLLEKLSTTVSGGELTVSCRDCDQSSNAIIRVTTPDIDRIEVSGASRVTAEDVTGERLVIEVSGASRLEIDGSVRVLEIGGSGASRIDGERLAAERLEINLSGASRVDVEVTDRAEGNLSGASRLALTGDENPVVAIDVSGGSAVDR